MNSTYTVTTDSPQKFVVESQLAYVLWMQGRAFAGFEAEFEVKTILAGDGSKVKATCRTAKGKKLAVVEGGLILNRFRGKVLIPDSVKPDDYIYLETELSKLGLRGESNLIPVRASLQVSEMSWSKKEIRREEEVHLKCIFVNGVEEGDRVTVLIFEYDPDGCHDLVVKIPAEVEDGKVELDWRFDYQGHTGSIPTETERNKYEKSYTRPEYFFVVAVENVHAGKNQESGLLTFIDGVRLFYCDGNNQPVPNASYTLKFADGTTREGKLDGDGRAVVDDVPPGKVEVEFSKDDE